MDRMTKVVLWIIFLVVAGYFIWLFGGCAIDKTCHIVCGSDTHGLPPIAKGMNGGCSPRKAPFAWSWLVEKLPSELLEDLALTHDYISVAVEFDNGQDITYGS